MGFRVQSKRYERLREALDAVLSLRQRKLGVLGGTKGIIDVVVEANMEIEVDGVLKIPDGISLVGDSSSVLLVGSTLQLNISGKSGLGVKLEGLVFQIPKERSRQSFINIVGKSKLEIERCSFRSISGEEYPNSGPALRIISVKDGAELQFSASEVKTGSEIDILEIYSSESSISFIDANLKNCQVVCKEKSSVLMQNCVLETPEGCSLLVDGQGTCEVSGTRFHNSVVGFVLRDLDSCEFSDCIIKGCKGNGGEVFGGSASFKKSVFDANAANGLLVGDRAEVKISSNCLFRKNGQVGLQVFSKNNVPSNIEEYTQCIVLNGTFLENGYGVGIDNSRVQVLGSTFINSKISSFDIKFRENDLQIHRNIIRLAWNNFFESAGNEIVSDTLRGFVRTENSFRGNEAFEINIWSRELYERILKAYRLKEFRINKHTEDVDTIMHSVFHCFKLLPPRIEDGEVEPGLESIVLEHLLENRRSAFFAGTYKFGKNARKELYTFQDILKSWERLRYPSHFDDAISCVDEFYKAGMFTAEESKSYVTKLKTFQLNCFREAKPGRQINYLMGLSRAHPLRSYNIASMMEPGVVQSRILEQLVLSENEAENSDMLHISWIAHDALNRLGLEFANAQPIKQELMLPWCDLNLEYNNPEVVYRALSSNPLYENHFLLNEARFLLGKSLGEGDSIASASTQYTGEGPIPGYIRRLSQRSSSLAELFESLRQVPQFPSREALIFGACYGYLINDTEPVISNDWKNCSGCSILLEPDQQVRVAACKLDHHWCKLCFSERFDTNADSEGFATCPGENCHAQASRRDMELGQTEPDVILATMRSRIFAYMHEHFNGWKNCYAESCCGGSSKIIDETYFVCVLCGAFNALEGAELNIHSDPRIQRALTLLYKSAASNSQHLEHFFPFEGCSLLFADKHGNPDVSKLRSKAEGLPVDMNNREVGDDHQIYSLLRYIIETQSTSFRVLDRIPNCILNHISGSQVHKQTLEQYEIYQVQSEQEKEIYFQQAKAEHGSYYAWHGSSPCNWHNILRTGLQVMSGSKYQRNGAAYGEGIYVSPDFGLAMSYSRHYNGTLQTQTPELKTGVAFVEVVNSPTILIKGTIHVVPADYLVQIRYVFLMT